MLQTMLRIPTRAIAALLLTAALLTFISPTPLLAGESELWGKDGQKWSPQSRLPDFSFAGYRNAAQPIPVVPAVAQAADFGLKGDGVTDDAPALQKALDQTKGGALVLPAGRFVLQSPVIIRHGQVVLRGAGTGKTILVIPRSLQQYHLATDRSPVKQTFSFSGGFVAIQGDERGKKLTTLAQLADRGSRVITLTDDVAPPVGTRVRVVMGPSVELGREIHGGENAGPMSFTEIKQFFGQIVTVLAVDGKQVTVDQPMRLPVKPEWGAELWSFEPTVEEVGIEGLTFEFPGVPKKEHLNEEGFNAIFTRSISNCWISDVEILDSDNAVNMQASNFCTIRRVVCRAPKRQNPSGHHALWVKSGAQDCLFTEFDIQTQFIHDLTVEGRATGNVFMNGRGESLNFDHHRNMPYENLFTNLDAGDGTRLWASSGQNERGPHTGVRSTFWNIRHNGVVKLPRLPSFMQANIIGVAGYPAAASNAKGQWIEPVKEGLSPTNLYEAQLARRTAQTPATQPGAIAK